MTEKEVNSDHQYVRRHKPGRNMALVSLMLGAVAAAAAKGNVEVVYPPGKEELFKISIDGEVWFENNPVWFLVSSQIYSCTMLAALARWCCSGGDAMPPRHTRSRQTLHLPSCVRGSDRWRLVLHFSCLFE